MKAPIYFSLLIIAFASQNACSQNNNMSQYKNSFQIELGGHGGIYALYYERKIVSNNLLKTSGQLGFSFYPGYYRDIWLPIEINEQISFGSNHIELGLGIVGIRVAEMELDEIQYRYWANAITGRIGYRYQKSDGRLILRIGLTPFLTREGEGGLRNPGAPYKLFIGMGGLSVGYAF